MLTGYGEERHRSVMDVLTTLHGLLDGTDAESVTTVLDMFTGWVRPDLSAAAIEACNAGWRC